MSRFILLMRLFAIASVPALAATPLRAQLPDAASIIAKYNAAVGGDAMLKHKSAHSVGTFELPTAGMAGNLDVYRTTPNRSLVRVTIPGMGEIMKGYDGTTAWSLNPMEGARLISGKEADQQIEEGDVAASLRGARFFSSMETVEKTTMGGTDCYKIKLVWKTGRTTYDCYGVDNGLLVGSMITQDTPQGPVDVTTTVSEYKQFGDVTVPTKIKQSVMGQEIVMTITSMEFDKVDDAVFVTPAAVQALVKKP